VTRATRYAIQRKVVHEAFDDEVIVVNLESGSYYSVSGSGASIWKLIDSGATLPAVVQAVGATYQGDQAEIERAVGLFVDELRLERLIAPVERADDARDDDSATSDVTPPLDADRPTFEAPVLEKYTDMEQLLLLDPIHDVDETGWPNAAPVPVAREP
jgi:hypothetical protein